MLEMSYILEWKTEWNFSDMEKQRLKILLTELK